MVLFIYLNYYLFIHLIILLYLSIIIIVYSVNIDTREFIYLNKYSFI